MKFWDTSALMPLLVLEDATPVVRMLFRDDPTVAVSFITDIELSAGVARRSRNDEQVKRAAVQRALEDLRDTWLESKDYDEIMAVARYAAETHHLRAGDAIQLASAIVLCRNRPRLPLVTLDRDLAAAARLEGFPTLP